jgi:hypothetical protein
MQLKMHASTDRFKGNATEDVAVFENVSVKMHASEHLNVRNATSD